MFDRFSKAGVGMYGTILTGILSALGLDITPGDADTIILTIMNLVSLILWAYGQFDRKDVKYGVKRV